MNIIFVINLIYLLVFLAQPAALNHSKNEDTNTAVRSGKIVNSIAKRSHNFVPLCLCNFATLKNKTNPKRTQTNPIFQTPNLVLSEKIEISANFRQHFLCKTKPIVGYKKSMRHQKTLKMTNKAILKIDQLNVTNVLTTDYNRIDTWYRGKNKAISKPFCFEN